MAEPASAAGPGRIEVALNVAAPSWQDVGEAPGAPGSLQALVEGAVRAAVAATALPHEADLEVSVLLSDDAQVRALNAHHRGCDRATNVLSFPADLAAAEAARGLPGLLGDVVLAFETVAGEAHDQGKTVADHLVHLVVHGVLHLRGFEHQDEAAAAAMEDLERRLLADLGITDPYAADDRL